VCEYVDDVAHADARRTPTIRAFAMSFEDCEGAFRRDSADPPWHFCMGDNL
jgi:hypothetical protein